MTMAEPKPIASLSAGLLARKGSARPAMRRQLQNGDGDHHGLDDLGWNDMGYIVDPDQGGADQGTLGHDRAKAHGLSPMSHGHVELGGYSASGAAASHGAHSASAEQAAQLPSIHDISPAEQLDRAVEHASLQDSHAQPVAGAVHSDVYEVPQVPEVRLQQQAIAAAMADPVTSLPAEVIAPQHADTPVPQILSVRPVSPATTRGNVTERARAGSRGNFAFTLRLDPERHLRLRIASATSNRSTQQILINLVDDFLTSLPEIDAFAAQLPSSKRHASL